MVESGDFPFRVVSVRGKSVRLKTGAVSFEATVEEHGDGTFRVELPHSPYIYPEHLERLIKLIRAHHRGEGHGEKESP